QREHDGRFPTCPYPNPELPEALVLGERYAREADADLLIATDPDCDRIGIVLKNGGEYVRLTGNEVGILLFDYLASQRKKHGRMPCDPLAVKTIVTTALAEKLAADYGVGIKNVLTGFKYIGETIGALEAEGRENRYLFGFEESCGYLAGTYVRDKDGVGAAFLVTEMCAFYLAQGKSAADRLAEIYEKYGYTENSLYSYSFPGADGFTHMQEIMKTLRYERGCLGCPVTEVEDYLPGKDGLPPADVLVFRFADGASLVVRPSGTEPKIKIYISVSAPDREKAAEQTATIRRAAETVIR
ncbi:MAG: phospho-sugar mutase, partial [Clostridia bacterium]|nr:phospho-sugar mutase [Clostridia bacterium]